MLGHVSGTVVSMLACHYDDPTRVNSFYSVNCLERTKINGKEAGNGPLLQTNPLHDNGGQKIS